MNSFYRRIYGARFGFAAPEGEGEGGGGAGGEAEGGAAKSEGDGADKGGEVRRAPARKHGRSQWAAKVASEGFNTATKASAKPGGDKKEEAAQGQSSNELEARLAKLAAIEKSLTDREEREATKSRLAALKAARPTISDKQLLEYSPKVDPDTPEGSRALAKWVEENSNFFERATLPAGSVPKQIDEIVKGAKKAGKSRLLREDKVRARASKTFGLS